MSCLHVYISKFNRCQLIQFCDYCCALSFVSCHFPFVCPLSFLISTTIVGFLCFFLFLSFPRVHPFALHLFFRVRNLFDERQVANQKPPIIYLGRIVCFPQRSYIISVTHRTVRLHHSRSLTHSFHMIHFILSAFITFLVTFLHLFSVRRCYCSRICFCVAFYRKTDSFFFLPIDLVFQEYITFLFDFFNGIFVIRHSFSSALLWLLVTAAIFILSFFLSSFFVECAVCANLRSNSRFFILSHLTHSAHFDDAHSTIGH